MYAYLSSAQRERVYARRAATGAGTRPLTGVPLGSEGVKGRRAQPRGGRNARKCIFARHCIQIDSSVSPSPPHASHAVVILSGPYPSQISALRQIRRRPLKKRVIPR